MVDVGSFIAGALSILALILGFIVYAYFYAKKHNLIQKGDKKE